MCCPRNSPIREQAFPTMLQLRQAKFTSHVSLRHMFVIDHTLQNCRERKTSSVGANAQPFAAGALIALAFVHNLLRRHPACGVLLHRSPRAVAGPEPQPSPASGAPANGAAAGRAGAAPSAPADADAGVDVYREDAADPADSRAIESSLWELDSLRNHYCPQARPARAVRSARAGRVFLRHTGSAAMPSVPCGEAACRRVRPAAERAAWSLLWDWTACAHRAACRQRPQWLLAGSTQLARAGGAGLREARARAAAGRGLRRRRLSMRGCCRAWLNAAAWRVEQGGARSTASCSAPGVRGRGGRARHALCRPASRPPVRV